MLHQPLRLLFITNQPQVATYVCKLGVDRVFVDLEMLGKTERQGHLDTVISRHTVEDVERVRAAVPPGALLVRTNPVNADTSREVEQVLRYRPDVLMLPMFRQPAEVDTFCRIVDGRAKVCLLLETVDAMNSVDECVRIRGVDEVHIGLNDLHLELGCTFMFQPLADGHVDRLARAVRQAGLPLGIGGVARVGEGLLPAELLLAEHARLGSTGAILSRTFHRMSRSVAEIESQMSFADEVEKLRRAYRDHCDASALHLRELHESVRGIVASIAAGQAERRARG
jgi:citrate lyase beta subunit